VGKEEEYEHERKLKNQGTSYEKKDKRRLMREEERNLLKDMLVKVSPRQRIKRG